MPHQAPNASLILDNLFNDTDNEGPVITTPASVPGINVQPGMADVVVNWSPLPSANDVVEGTIPSANITCEDDAGNVVMSGDRFRAGTTTVTCKANDTSLNEGSKQFTITVIGESFFENRLFLTENDFSEI